MKTITVVDGLSKIKKQNALILLDTLGSLTVHAYRIFGGKNLTLGITEKIFTSVTLHKNMAVFKPSVLPIPQKISRFGVVSMLLNLVQTQLQQATTLGLVIPYFSHKETK